MNTPEKLIKTGVRMGASAGLFISTIISPIDSPKEVKAESNIQEQNSLTLLHGDGGRNRLNILLVSQNGTTLGMLNEVKEDLSSIDPMKEIVGDANIYGLLNVEDLGCDQNARCNWSVISRIIDRIAATSVIPHETMIVIKSNDDNHGNGNAIQSNHLNRPDIYTPSAIVRSIDTRGRREQDAGTVIHEFLHQFAGFGHEGGDIMERKCHCINSDHAQFLRALKPLIPQNYLTPQNEIRVKTPGILSTEGAFQSSQMSLDAVVLSPTGTTQLYSELRPFNNDGPGVFDYVGTLEAVHAWSEIGRRIPPPPEWYGLLPDMSYAWKVCSSGLSIPLSASDPRWTTVEGWPGAFFPNPCDVKTFRTPKRGSEKIALTSPATTNDLTPVLTWENGDKDVFYYEVQVSKDATFSQEPGSPFLYWELRHGGVTNPNNSYTISSEFPLEKGTNYFWRVRPRIQGDGTPVAWSNPGIFRTSADARVQMYSQELIDKDYGNGVIGPSKEDYDRANQPY